MITGAAGGMGLESVERDVRARFKVVGIDQGWRQRVFGPEAFSFFNQWKPVESIPRCPRHNFDICNRYAVENFFALPV